ncbi:hypothetical protein SLE2022_325120 [Rubroshorea leprosula]
MCICIKTDRSNNQCINSRAPPPSRILYGFGASSLLLPLAYVHNPYLHPYHREKHPPLCITGRPTLETLTLARPTSATNSVVLLVFDLLCGRQLHPSNQPIDTLSQQP